jgi:hypothetical protein
MIKRELEEAIKHIANYIESEDLIWDEQELENLTKYRIEIETFEEKKYVVMVTYLNDQLSSLTISDNRGERIIHQPTFTLDDGNFIQDRFEIKTRNKRHLAFLAFNDEMKELAKLS